MKLPVLLSSTLLLSAIPAIAGAETITNFTTTVTTGSHSELGRPTVSTTLPQQSWTHDESYQGVTNPGITYYYNTYTFNSSLFAGAPYVELTVTDTLNNVNDFVVAYSGAYDPSSRGTGWLGNEGYPGNYFGNVADPRYFDVVLPVGQDLVVWVGNLSTSPTGFNDPINIEIDAYADTDYDDPVAVPPPPTVPEPASFITLGTGLLSVLGVARRRTRRT